MTAPCTPRHKWRFLNDYGFVECTACRTIDTIDGLRRSLDVMRAERMAAINRATLAEDHWNALEKAGDELLHWLGEFVKESKLATPTSPEWQSGFVASFAAIENAISASKKVRLAREEADPTGS